MERYESELRDKWNSINYYAGGSIQLAIEHPLDWFVRYAAPEQKSVVIVTDNPVDNITSSKSIEAVCNQRKDGKYAVSFTLIDSQQEDVFITMSGDIIQFSNAEYADAAMKKVIKRYAAWMKLLDHKNSALLSINAQKGLIGELLFLKEKMDLGMNASEAVAGWGGPDGADQDFSYSDGWYEIKVTGASSDSVSISSIEQLDSNQEGELVIFRIDKCVPTKVGAFTLYRLVHLIFDMLHREEDILNAFILKLGAAGYIDMLEYDKQTFALSAKQAYQVNDSFPRLVRRGVPSEIINAEYQLSIQSITSWAK
jgi:hypothetical protein